MHAAVGNQPEEMRSMSACRGKRFLQNTIAFQFAVGDRLVNPGKVLINDSARSEIKMANFQLPICPSGKPTSMPLALNRDRG